MGRAQSSTSRRTLDDLLAATAAEIDALLDRLISGDNAPAEGLVSAMRRGQRQRSQAFAAMDQAATSANVLALPAPLGAFLLSVEFHQ